MEKGKIECKSKKNSAKNKHVFLFFTPFAVSLHYIYIILCNGILHTN